MLLALLGVAAALGAALRAQAAVELRGYLAEAVPMALGLALLSLSLGTPAGIDAAIVALAGASVLAGVTPLLPGTARGPLLTGLGIAAGLPPGLVFAGWLLAVQAALGAGAAFPLLSLAAGAAWLLWAAGFARAVRLPAAKGTGGVTGAWVGVGIGAIGGVGAAAIESLLALPAAGEVIRLPASLSSVTLLPVAQPSGGWSPLLLGLPLVVLLVLASVAGPRVSPAALVPKVAAEAPPPLLPGRLHLAPPTVRVRIRSGLFGGLGGSVVGFMTHSSPWVWAAITLALVLAVTR
jgi:hypothetical protein